MGSYETTDEGFRAHFEQFGEIVDSVVMRDRDTGKSKGFGFVTFKEIEQIDEAQRSRPHHIDGRDVDTKRSMPRDSGESQKSLTKMFIGGMKDDTTEEQVREVFEPYGEMKSCDIIRDKATGKCKGFGFIEYEDYDSVDRCVLKKRHELNGKTVEVKKAVPKEEMSRDQGMGGGRRDDGYGGSSGGGGFSGFGGGFGGQGDYGNSWGGNFGGNDFRGGMGGGYGGRQGGFDGGNWGQSYGNNYGGGAMKSGGFGGRPGPYNRSGSGGGGRGGGFRR